MNTYRIDTWTRENCAIVLRHREGPAQVVEMTREDAIALRDSLAYQIDRSFRMEIRKTQRSRRFTRDSTSAVDRDWDCRIKIETCPHLRKRRKGQRQITT
jgi:hypothetical protein